MHLCHPWACSARQAHSYPRCPHSQRFSALPCCPAHTCKVKVRQSCRPVRHKLHQSTHRNCLQCKQYSGSEISQGCAAESSRKGTYLMRRNRFRLSSLFEKRKLLTVRIWAAAGVLLLPCSRQSWRTVARAMRLWMCLLFPANHCSRALLSHTTMLVSTYGKLAHSAAGLRPVTVIPVSTGIV